MLWWSTNSDISNSKLCLYSTTYKIMIASIIIHRNIPQTYLLIRRTPWPRIKVIECLYHSPNVRRHTQAPPPSATLYHRIRNLHRQHLTSTATNCGLSSFISSDIYIYHFNFIIERRKNKIKKKPTVYKVIPQLIINEKLAMKIEFVTFYSSHFDCTN